MTRKNTILIAVFINACLIAILLIAALTTQEEPNASFHVMSDSPPNLPSFEDKPLFTESVECLASKVAEEPLVHKIPPLVPEVIASAGEASILPPIATGASIEVSVKKGDTLEKIAKTHSTTVDEIIRINQLPSSFLRVGQVLKLSKEKNTTALSPKSLPPKETDGGPEYYTMKVGENPWSIAMKHHIKVSELLRLNALNEEKARKLKPGDRLRIR